MAKMSAGTITGMAAAMSEAGIQSELGGTAFQRLVTEITKAVGTGNEKLRVFAKGAGKTSKEFQEAWKKDAIGTLMDFAQGMADLEGVSQGKSIQLIDKLKLDGIRISNVLLKMAYSQQRFRDILRNSNIEHDKNIALTREANIFYNIAISRLKVFRNKVILLAKSFGDVLVPEIEKFLSATEPYIQKMKALDSATKLSIVKYSALAIAMSALLIPLGVLFWSIGSIAVGLAKIWAAIKIIGIAIGAVISFFSLPLLAITALFVGLVALIYDLWKAFKYGDSVLLRLWKKMIGPLTTVWDIVKRISKLMFFLPSTIASQIKWGKTFDNNEGVKTSEMLNSNSQTDINIKVSSDQGSTATVDGVKSKGDANINVINDILLGQHSIMGNL
jgi:hypothetical protein